MFVDFLNIFFDFLNTGFVVDVAGFCFVFSALFVILRQFI